MAVTALLHRCNNAVNCNNNPQKSYYSYFSYYRNKNIKATLRSTNLFCKKNSELSIYSYFNLKFESVSILSNFPFFILCS